jgi:uncharacterized protein (DUF1499 family)
MKIALYLILALLGGVFVGARFGLFSGQQPDDLGVHDGRLKPPSATRNSVSSQTRLYPAHPQRDYAAIAPLPVRAGDGAASLRTLAAVLRSMPDIRIVEQRPDYLYAQASTRWLKFVDDVEFWVNPVDGVIEVRSASRLGREDFGVNRKRLERIRAAYLAD